jgi:NADPH:quinone reductase-like Zn-dependent oxidoreductase
MRAMARTEYGPPSSLRLTDRPKPVPEDNEVLVRVVAAGIDAGTWHLITGTPYLMRLFGFGVRAPKNPVPGLAFAGQIAAVGAGVGTAAGTGASGFSVGDNVIGSAPGALAEYVAIDPSQIRRMPPSLDHVHAAALPISAVTALEAVREARITRGDRVLVIGAGGGVGHFAVQLAVAAGAEVTGLCSAAKAEFVRSLGATDVIDYRTTDVTTLDRTWDAIIDTAGGRPLRQIRRVLAPSGTLVIVGAENGGKILGGTEHLLVAAAANAFSKQRLRGLVSRENPADYEELASLVEKHALAPHIDHVFPLDESATAIEYLHGGSVRGKVVVRV